MTLTTLQTNAFRFNKDEESANLRFPDIALRAYSFNIQIANEFYVVRVSYNIWANSPQVSILDAAGIIIVSNAPLIERLADTFPNYLYGKPEFSGYYLVWDLDVQAFLFLQETT